MQEVHIFAYLEKVYVKFNFSHSRGSFKSCVEFLIRNFLMKLFQGGQISFIQFDPKNEFTLYGKNMRVASYRKAGVFLASKFPWLYWFLIIFLQLGSWQLWQLTIIIRTSHWFENEDIKNNIFWTAIENNLANFCEKIKIIYLVLFSGHKNDSNFLVVFGTVFRNNLKQSD